MKIGVKVGVNNAELNSFDGKINNLVYFENNKPLVELESIDLEGNLMQGYVAISSITTIEPSINSYRDLKIELSPTGNVKNEKEITLSFRSKVNDLISVLPKMKSDLTWLNSFARSQGEKEVSFTYSKAIALNKIEKFFTPEKNIFELKLKNLLIPFTTKNSVNLDSLNLKGVGNTIFFEGVMANDNKKISGSIDNVFSNISNEDKPGGLVIFFDDLDTEMLLPQFSSFKIKGQLSVAIIDLTTVEQRPLKVKSKYNPLPKFPGSVFDCTIVADSDTPVAQVLAALKKVKAKELVGTKVVDVYQMSDQQKSITLQSEFLDPEATLEGETIKKLEDQIVSTLDKAGFPLKS